MNASRRKFIQQCGVLTAATTLPAHARIALGTKRWTHSLSGHAYGTDWTLIVNQSERNIKQKENIENVLRKIAQMISPFQSDSTVSAFNRSGVKAQTQVSPLFMDLVKTSVAIAKLSNGAFDPTVGPFVNRFGFGPIKGSEDCLYTDIKWNQLQLIKQKPGLTLDFCGMGKGYAIDMVSMSLRALGLNDFLFELGGEFAAVGHHPSGREWTVAIEPMRGSINSAPVIGLTDTCIATSGLHHNYFNAQGRRYGHLIDTKSKSTARPLCHSVSVQHKSAMYADAWATALYVAGPDQGFTLAQSQGISAFFMAESDTQQESIGTGIFKDIAMAGVN